MKLGALLPLACLVACAGEPPARTGPPPIVLVSIDTFRADRIGAFGNEDGLTPNLDAFAAESVVFESAWSQAIQTAPSHTSLFTSRYPSEEIGSDGQPYVPKDIPLLAQLLSLYDYETAAFVGGGDLSPHRGLAPGFDTYKPSKDFGSLYHTGPMGLAWLDERGGEKPYFLFVHGYDTHSRYLKPSPFGYVWSDARLAGVGQYAVRTAVERIVDGVFYADFTGLMNSYSLELRPRSAAARARFVERAGNPDERLHAAPEDLALIRHVYDGAVSYADTMFGLFMAGLQDRGVLDEAVVVVLSDHGEQLGENGLFGHCCEANDQETHVPLMIRLPRGEGGGRRVSGRVELVDVMPTLLEIAEATPPARMHGHSLVPALRGEPFSGRPYAFTQGSEMMRLVTMRGPKGRLTFAGLSATSTVLPDLVEVARIDGPGFESTEGVTIEERRNMRAAMVAWLRTLTPSEGGSHGELPEALRKSLREHGYWDVKP